MGSTRGDDAEGSRQRTGETLDGASRAPASLPGLADMSVAPLRMLRSRHAASSGVGVRCLALGASLGIPSRYDATARDIPCDAAIATPSLEYDGSTSSMP